MVKGAMARARKARMMELKHDRVCGEMLARLTGCALSHTAEEDVLGDSRLSTEGVGPLGKSIFRSEEALKWAYLGAQ